MRRPLLRSADAKLARPLSLVAPVMALSALAYGCMPNGAPLGRGVGGNGGSLVASVDGIDKADRENAKVGFWLKCQSGVDLKGEGATGDKIRFATANQVTDKDTCWIEVRMDEAEAQALPWDWFGKKKDGKKAVGLLYASTEDVVGDDRALQLTVYKLYAIQGPKPFKAVFKAKFDGIDMTKVPADDETVGSLVCGSETHGGGVYSRDAADPALATFTFATLEASKMRAVDCQALVVLVKNKPEYEAELTGVGFPKPKKGDEYTFTQEGGEPFVIKVKPQGGLDVDTVAGGLCLNKVEGGPCTDRRRVKLDAPASYLFVVVTGIKGSGESSEVVDFIAGAGTGFGLYAKDELVLADMKLTGTADAPAPFTYYVYSDTLMNSVLSGAFDEDLVKGTAFVSQKASAEELEGVTLLHLDRVQMHRLNTVTEAQLDAKSSARWLAKVKAKKADQSEVEFLVGGKAPYLYSATKPAGDKYLDVAGLVADMQGAGSDRYAVYALKGKAMAPAGCELDEKGYADLMAKSHLGDLAATTGVAALDDCEVRQERFDLGLEGATVLDKTFKVWDWSVN